MKIKLSVIFLFVLLMSGCSSDPIKADLLNYINVEMVKVSDLESKAVGAYESVSGTNYKGDSLMYASIKSTVIPTYQEFYDKLADIKPATEQIAAMHKEYVEAAADNLEAFKLILEAIEKQDAALITQANTDLGKGRTMIDEWKIRLDEECKSHEIVLKPKV